MESIVGTKVKVEFSLKVMLSCNTFHTISDSASARHFRN